MVALNGPESSWTYDTRGRTLSATHVVPVPASGSVTRTFQWEYNSANSVTRLTFPAVNGSSEAVTYAYDAGGKATSVCISTGGCYAQSLQYNALGFSTFRRHGNNAVQGWLYDSPLSRLDRIQVGTDSAPGSLFDRSYDYDAVGNVTLIADNTSPGIPDQNYTYDYRDRLISWKLGSTTQNYDYDLIGNLTNKAGVTQGYGPQSASCPNGALSKPHALTSAGTNSYCYNQNGNMVSGAGRTYTWTAENMPASITTPSGTESYTYTADNARVTRTRGSTTTIYLEGMWEEVVGGTTTKYYTLGGSTVALRTHSGSTSSVSYLHGDHLGSAALTTGATGSPSTPVLQSQQEFDPWGWVRAGSMAQTRRNFTGQYLDETGLLFYNARYYDPVIGRFVSADTMVPGSNALTVWPGDPVAGGAWGGGGGPANPQDLNRYSYALNNPVRFTDPTGHFLDTLLDVGFIAYGVYDIAANGYTHERGISLAADVIGAIIPGVTGLGAAVRVANRADDAIAAARAAQRAADAKKADEARRAAEAAAQAEEAARKAADAQRAEAARRTVPVSKQCSFSPDTPVLTPDGPVPIGAVTVGAEVLAYHEASDTLGSYPVVAVWSHRDPIRVTLTLDGETIATTPEHPFLVVGVGWVPAALLQPGDLIFQADGTPGRLRAIHIAEQPAVMYNITVATAHTYFVGDGGWLVHNACDERTSRAMGLANTAGQAHGDLPRWLRRSTVAAGRNADGTVILSAYHRTPEGTVDTINALRNNGWNVLDPPAGRGPDFHAERQLYDEGFTEIGISRQKGMCSFCQEYFSGLDAIIWSYRQRR